MKYRPSVMKIIDKKVKEKKYNNTTQNKEVEMNVFRKISVFIFLLLFIGSTAFGATVALTPSTVPIGAYLNGSDGDQYFMQCLKITLAEDGGGAYANGEDIIITLPTSMTIADVDDDGSYEDEVSVSSTVAVAVAPTVEAAGAATSTTITIDLATGGAAAAGDIIVVFFPVLIPNTVTDGLTETYSFSTTGGDEEASFTTTTVTYEADQLSLVTFAAAYNGGDASSDKGDVYPAAVQAVTAALPDWIEDQSSGAVDAVENGSSNWDGITLDNDDDATAGGTLADAETQFYLWASMDSSLLKVSEVSNGHRPIVYLAGGQPTRANAIAATGGAGARCDSDIETGTFSDVQLNGSLLTEGTWYFYVTSSVTSDWVIGRSDSVAIKHYPVFNAYNDATIAGVIFDYDADGLFEQNSGDANPARDNQTVMYLESGGGVGADGQWGSAAAQANTDNVKIHWEVDDVDDNANIKIYTCTTDGITDKETLLANVSTVQISPDTLYEEGINSQYWTYDIYTDATTYEPAGTYYIYAVADDGKHSTVYQVQDDAGTDFQLYVKHFPYLEFQDLDLVGALYEPTDGGDANSVDINTNDYQYILINWGQTIDGDMDADGDMIIKLYMSDLTPGSGGTAGYNDAVASADSSLLAADAVNDPTHTVHIATIIDNADGRTDNQYMFDVRNSGLVAGTYYIYAVITQNGDAQVVKYEGSATFTDNTFTIAHGQYLLPSTPPQGEIVNLNNTDRYEIKWNGFDKDGTATDMRVGIFMVPDGSAITAGANFDSDAAHHVDGYWLTSTGTGQSIILGANAPLGTDGKYVVDFGAITTDINGDAVLPSGDYDVYLTYTDDADFTDAADDYCIKADGMLHITTFADQVTSFEISPNRITAEKGDTISLNIYADDGGGANDKAMFVSVFLNVPAAKFSVLDQDASVAGIQPWSDETTNFNGTEFLDTVYTVGSDYHIDHVEYAAGGDAIATSLIIGTIQLVVTDNYDNDALEAINVTFNTSGTRTTEIIEEDNNVLSTSVPSIAATIELATPGKISGNVEMEARNPEGETVDIYVCPEGSFTQISDPEFLEANGLTSATEVLTLTLGAGGSYEVLNVPTGIYDVIVYKDGFLGQRIESQTVQPLSVTNVDFEGSDKLLAGDCAGYTDANSNVVPDNQISAADNSAISTAFNSSAGDVNWNEYCDIDGDGLVWVDDLNWTVKNTGNGEGVLYKKVDYKGNNNNATMMLVKDEVGNYIIKGENLANVRAYAAKLSFNAEDYEVTEFVDGLERHNETFKFYQFDDNSVYFVSAVRGESSVESMNLELCKIVLTPKVNDPVEPTLVSVSVIDAYQSEVNVPISSQSLNSVPTVFSLEKNYPNPFNPTTTIKYALPVAGNVRLVVFDLLGNKVQTLVSSNLKAGRYEAVWNAQNSAGIKVSSGVYFYRLMSDNKVIDTKKMVLMK